MNALLTSAAVYVMLRHVSRRHTDQSINQSINLFSQLRKIT